MSFDKIPLEITIYILLETNESPFSYRLVSRKMYKAYKLAFAEYRKRNTVYCINTFQFGLIRIQSNGSKKVLCIESELNQHDEIIPNVPYKRDNGYRVKWNENEGYSIDDNRHHISGLYKNTKKIWHEIMRNRKSFDDKKKIFHEYGLWYKNWDSCISKCEMSIMVICDCRKLIWKKWNGKPMKYHEMIIIQK